MNTKKELEITILSDMNSIIGDEYITSGVSFFIDINTDSKPHKLLFDTSYNGDELVRNAEHLSKDLSNIDSIFLSHGHFDHTNGLTKVLSKAKKKPNLYCHENIFLKKVFYRNTEKEQNIGITASNDLDYIRNNSKITPITGTKELITCIWSISEIPRTIEKETITGHLQSVKIMNTNGQFTKDKIEEDSSLVIELANNKLFLIIGCGHSGILNLIDHVKNEFPSKKLTGILGGLQLHDKSEDYIHKVVDRIKELKPEIICPIHSTGENAISILKNELHGVYHEGGVGTKIKF